MFGIDMFYMKGSQIWARTQNTTCVPRAGDCVVMNNIKVVVKEVIWHLENSTWVEIQVAPK